MASIRRTMIDGDVHFLLVRSTDDEGDAMAGLHGGADIGTEEELFALALKGLESQRLNRRDCPDHISPFVHVGTRTLHTDRLTLRRFETADAAAMYANWASDPEVTRFLTWEAHEGVAASRAVLASWVDSYHDPTFYQWAIVPNELGEPIGSIGVVRMRDDIGQLEVGYCIGRRWWGRRITSEALRAVLAFLFDEVGALRIQAIHDSKNPRSGQVMRACGMRHEGSLRQADRNNQGIVDVCVYGMLRHDWQQEQ